MSDYIEEFIFYGDDLKIERFPSDTQFIYANPPMEPLADYDRAIKEALDNPLDAEPLETQLTSSSRVTIAFDDPCLPIPLVRRDMRGLVIEELLRRLDKLGVKKDRIRLICANGLHRKWTMKELSIVLGKKVVADMGPNRISCHDATREDDLISLGTTEAGQEVEINRAIDESDMTIYVNVNFSSMNGGWKSILVGLGSWRSIRHHHTPKEWNMKQSIMDPATSPMHEILCEMGKLVRSKYNIFQIETVMNNNIWPRPLEGLLRPLNKRSGNSAPGMATRSVLSLASLSPQMLKRNIRNSLIRSDYRLCGISAGDVDEVHKKTLDILFRQQNVKVKEPVDILVFGVPNLSPYSAQSVFNPILLRGLTMGYLSGLFRGRPLVKEGGVIVACNPGFDKFNLRHHGAYKDFWDNDLEDHYDPEECWDALAEKYADNPDYIRKYRDDYAYHGTHGLINWMWSGMGMRHVKGVILAGAKEPETARKIGFTPAPDFASAIAMAREMAGNGASMAYQVIPPLFCVDVGS
jgi:hypothetical protein